MLIQYHKKAAECVTYRYISSTVVLKKKIFKNNEIKSESNFILKSMTKNTSKVSTQYSYFFPATSIVLNNIKSLKPYFCSPDFPDMPKYFSPLNALSKRSPFALYFNLSRDYSQLLLSAMITIL